MKTEPHTRQFARAHMFAHMPLVAACAFVLIFSASAGAQTTDAPRRPSGPAASPAIKLPRGAGAAEQSAAAKGEGARVVAAPQKWEYCAIVDFERRQKGFSLSSPYVTVAVVRYFPNNTEEIEGASVDDALANALAKLGDDGWELVAVKVEFNLTEGNGKSSPTYYFKRPKRQE